MTSLIAEITPRALFIGAIAYLVTLAVVMAAAALIFRGSTRLIVLGAVGLAGIGALFLFFYLPSVY